MGEIINIYCDESCHLENDNLKVMVLGGVWCLCDRVPEVSRRLHEIRLKHGFKPEMEIKWTKVSPGERSQSFYLDVLDYFFDDNDLHFRALCVPDKSILDHGKHHQTHDDWYYKMYFDMLKVIVDPKYHYHIYLDYKDTRGGAKVAKLHDVLANANYDFQRQIIRRLQIVRSHEVQLIQLADLLVGAVAYANRGLRSNAGKVALVDRLKERSGYTLTSTTLYREDKVNILRWRAKEWNNE